MPPFHCDHGDGIKLVNMCLLMQLHFLDGGYITLVLYTGRALCADLYATSSDEYQERRGSMEYAYPVTFGEDC